MVFSCWEVSASQRILVSPPVGLNPSIIRMTGHCDTQGLISYRDRGFQHAVTIYGAYPQENGILASACTVGGSVRQCFCRERRRCLRSRTDSLAEIESMNYQYANGTSHQIDNREQNPVHTSIIRRVCSWDQQTMPKTFASAR